MYVVAEKTAILRLEMQGKRLSSFVAMRRWLPDTSSTLALHQPQRDTERENHNEGRDNDH